MDYKNLFEIIITEIKKLSEVSMLYVFIISVICFLLDCFFIRHYTAHNWALDVFRFTYFVCGFFSNIFLFNRLVIKIQDTIQKRKQQKREAELYQQRLCDVYKKASPIIDTMTKEQKLFLKKFVDENSLEIALSNITETGYNSPVYLANYITVKVFSLGLNITITATFTHTFFTINQFYFDLLKMYFENISEGLEK